MINARTADEQRTTGALIAQKRGDLASSLQQLQKLDGGQPASKLLSLCQRLDANLAALEDITTERGAVRSQITALNDALYGTTRGWRNALRSFRIRVRRLKWPRTAISWST